MTAEAGTRERVLEVAAAEIGTVEHPPGSNRQKYGAAYSMNGVAWCAEFTWWVYKEAGVPLLLKSAYTPAIAAAYQREDLWLPNTSKAVRPGDMVLFYWPNMGRIAHIGIVEELLANGNLVCIEGNTDARGGRSGGRVMRQTRSRATVHRNGGFATPVFEGGAELDKEERKLLQETHKAVMKKVKGRSKPMAHTEILENKIDGLAKEAGIKFNPDGTVKK